MQHRSGTLSAVVDEGTHIVSLLISLIAGIWEPDPSELEQLLDHLVGCPACQTILGICITVQRRENWPLREGIDDVLSSLAATIHETLLQNDVSTYIEIVETHGEKEAYKQFPGLARHIEECQVCQADIKETRTLLHDAEEAGFIEPLPTNISRQ